MAKAIKSVGVERQTMYVILGKLIALASTLAIPLLLTRTITQIEYGLYSQFNTLVLFMTSIFSLGIQTNLYYFLPSENNENSRIYIFQTFIMLIALAVLAAIILLVPFVSDLLTGKSEISGYRLHMAIAIILMMPPFILESLYVVRMDLKTSLLFPPIQSFLKIASIATVLLFFSKTLENIFIAIILSLAIPFIFSIFYLKHILKNPNKSPLYDFKKLFQQMKYSLPYGSAVVLNTIIRRIDKIICITYLTTTEYAIYSLAFIGIPGIQQIYDAMSQVIIVKIVEAAKEGKQNKVLELYKQLVSKTLSFTIPLIFIVTWFTKDIIGILFTDNYVDATPFFQLYLTSFIIGMLGAGIILRATGNTKLTFKAYTISAFFIIPASFLLISNFGIWGAITTALLGAFLPKLIMIYMEIKIIGCKISEYFPWHNLSIILLISLSSLIPVIIISKLSTNNIYLTIITSIGYLIIVSFFEIKLDVFVVDQKRIRERFLLLFKNTH